VSLQYTVYNRCKANKAATNLDIIKESFTGRNPLEINVPYTWTYKTVGVVTPPPDTKFPNLGDEAVEHEMRKLNMPKAGCEMVEDIIENALEEDDEHPFEDLEETNFSIGNLPLNINRANKKKSKQVQSLFQLSEAILLKKKEFLVNCASHLLFQVEYKKFVQNAPISPDLLLPGLETPMDIIAVPETLRLSA
jgi:hypothetical protein